MSDSFWPYGLQPARLLCPWGFSRQEHWSGLSCPPPGDLPDPGIKPASLMSPALADKFFTTSAPWEAQMWAMLWEKKRIILKVIQRWPGLPPLYWLLSRAWGQGCSILGGLLPPGRALRDGPQIRWSEDGTTAPMSLEDGTTNPVGLEVRALK